MIRTWIRSLLIVIIVIHFLASKLNNSFNKRSSRSPIKKNLVNYINGDELLTTTTHKMTRIYQSTLKSGSDHELVISVRLDEHDKATAGTND